MEKKPLVILTGPTAVGKTALSIALAHMVNGEIISADSMQVYRHMDIGSAKIRPEEMNGVPHHLVDVLEPNEPFNVVVFQQMVKEAMEGIYARGHVPVLVGGTGFYIQAIVNDIDFTESEDDTEFRRQCERMAAEGRQQELFEQLKEVDPASAVAAPEKRCYTVEDLQIILACGRETVYTLLKKNEFRWFRVGGSGGAYRISKKSFDEWLDNKI